MPRYRVFIAYGGSSALTVASAMADCLWHQGLQPQIGAPGCRGSVSVARQEDLFRLLRTCHAVLAVNAAQSYNSRKFIDEVEMARYGDVPIPVLAFIEKGCKVIYVLKVGCTRIEFPKGGHKRKCANVASQLRLEIKRSNSVIVEERKDLPRRTIV